MKGPRRWRRKLVEALGFGRVADRWVGYSARCMTGLCRRIKSICAKWRADRGRRRHCRPLQGWSGWEYAAERAATTGRRARERVVGCKRGCKSGCECEVERAACSQCVSVSVSVSV